MREIQKTHTVVVCGRCGWSQITYARKKFNCIRCGKQNQFAKSKKFNYDNIYDARIKLTELHGKFWRDGFMKQVNRGKTDGT